MDHGLLPSSLRLTRSSSPASNGPHAEQTDVSTRSWSLRNVNVILVIEASIMNEGRSSRGRCSWASLWTRSRWSTVFQPSAFSTMLNSASTLVNWALSPKWGPLELTPNVSEVHGRNCERWLMICWPLTSWEKFDWGTELFSPWIEHP